MGIVEITNVGMYPEKKKIRTSAPTFELAKNLARAKFSRQYALLAITKKGHDLVTGQIILEAAEALTMF